jgi:uncharacterized protein YpuA (DUF1002 family)
MSKFNETIKSYIEEQNITFNPNAASAATVSPNTQLKNAADVMGTVKNLIQGQVRQTPEEFEKVLVTAFAPFGVKTPEDAYKKLEEFGFKRQQQNQQSDLNKTTTQEPTQQQAPPQQSSNTQKSQSSTYTTSAPKA